MKKTKPADLYVRLPDNKKYIKIELLKIAEKNNMTLGAVVALGLEWFVEAKKKGEIIVKIK